MKEILVMGQAEAVLEAQERLTFTIGEGSVGPAARIATGEISEQRVDEVVERLQTDEFYDEIDPESLPSECIECRPPDGEPQVMGADSAGGSFTQVAADALTHQSYRHPGEKAPTHAKRIYSELIEDGKPVKTHDADIAQGINCGCGAEDKLDGQEPDKPSILGYLTRRGNDIRQVVESLGRNVSDEQEALITSRAAQLRAEDYATNGAELKQACIEVAGPDSVETVTGVQKGVAVVINTRQGTRLNRLKLSEEFGDDYQAFSVDVWSLPNGAKATSRTEAEADDKEVAALFYNLAAGGVIAGPDMRVVIR